MTEDDPGALPTAEADGDTHRVGTVPTLLEAAVAYARELAAQNIREITRNSSPWIDRVLGQVNAKPGDAWCAAANFEIWLRASRAVGVPNPCPKTAGALRQYGIADEKFKIGAGVVRRDPALLIAGLSFYEDHSGDPRDGQGAGHCGLVLGWTNDPASGLVKTASGNVAPADSHSREGTAFAIQDRPIERMLAFLDFSR